MTLADATLVGLQAVNAAYGSQSAQAQAAWHLQAAVLQQAHQTFLAAFDNKCAPCSVSFWPRVKACGAVSCCLEREAPSAFQSCRQACTFAGLTQ